jgi:hypothetical protein
MGKARSRYAVLSTNFPRLYLRVQCCQRFHCQFRFYYPPILSRRLTDAPKRREQVIHDLLSALEPFSDAIHHQMMLPLRIALTWLEVPSDASFTIPIPFKINPPTRCIAFRSRQRDRASLPPLLRRLFLRVIRVLLSRFELPLQVSI